MNLPPVVIDNGTGYTKMGFAGNNEPQYIVPTCIATNSNSNTSSITKKIDDLDFHIGDDALANSKTYSVQYPIRHGTIDNWDLMEKFYQASIFQYLKCEPEDHSFLLVSINLTSIIIN
jgi:actin-related protein 3